MTEMTEGRQALEAAEARVREADAALETSTERLRAAREEFDGLSEMIATAAGDDDEGLGRLAAQRLTIQARVEALEGRRRHSEQQLQEARQARAAAELAYDKGTLATLDESAHAADAAIDGAIVEFTRRMFREMGSLREVVQKAAKLDERVIRAEGREASYRFGDSRGCRAAALGSTREGYLAQRIKEIAADIEKEERDSARRHSARTETTASAAVEGS